MVDNMLLSTFLKNKVNAFLAVLAAGRTSPLPPMYFEARYGFRQRVNYLLLDFHVG